MPEQPAPAPDLSSPSRARSWLRDLWIWFRKASWKQKTVLFILFLGVLVIVFELCFLAYLSYKSFTSDDLSIFLKTANDTLVLQHGATANISFTLGTRNLAFCTATCNWSVSDGSTAAVLANGTDALSRSRQASHAVQLTAPQAELSLTPYQIRVTCQSNQAYLCRSSGDVKAAAAIVMVNVTYTPEEQLAAASVRADLVNWSADALSLLRFDAALAKMTDQRILDAQSTAITEASSIDASSQQLQRLLASNDVIGAAALIASPLPNSSGAAYAAKQQQEQAAISTYSGLLHEQQSIDALLAVASPTDAGLLLSAAQLAAESHDEFGQQQLSQTSASFSVLNGTIAALTSGYTLQTVQLANTGASLLHSELVMACTLKAGECPANPANVTTLADAVSSLSSTCSQLAAINDSFNQSAIAYARTLNATASLAEVEQQYNVSAVRNQPDFLNLSAELMAGARNATLLDNNATMRLAVQLTVSDASRSFEQHCNLSNQSFTLPRSQLSATLPASPEANISLAPLELPQQRCCSLGECSVCAPHARYPVVFVHGHSFSSSTSPEDDLDAFTPMAFQLQKDGYVYAGHAFPATDFSGAADYTTIPAISFTATYYYNSYPQQGAIDFVPQKSENIETYAIRLKEAIDLVRQQSGSDRVVLVAHSMGGLVARSYMQIFGDQNVAALVMIATPNHGITGGTATLCPVFGGVNECDDMDAGSLFLDKLTSGQQPAIPVYTIAGVGCAGATDGVVSLDSVQLSYATNYVVNGTCADVTHLLHNTLLQPTVHPEVYAIVKLILDKYQ